MNKKYNGGYTLVELVVSVGLFAVIMTLAAGAYLVMISVSRQTQATSIGIDNLAFALETMTRTIRTGTGYTCIGGCSGATSFSVTNSSNATVTYMVSGGVLTQQVAPGQPTPLTDPAVNITSIAFYVYGAARLPDTQQPRVVILVSGTVSAGPGKPPTTFAVETEATMRGTDI